MTLRQDTHDLVCVVLEECAGQEVDEVAAEVLKTLALQGEEVLTHLDPPPGLQRWLLSHGLSLVVTNEAVSPRVWDALQEEEEEEEPSIDLERRTGGESTLQVGDFVEYRTAPSGPYNQSRIGSGHINAITSEGWVIVQDSPMHEQWLSLETDIIQLRTPAPAPEQSAPSPPW